MFGRPFKLDESRNLAICPKRFAANEKLCVLIGILLKEFLHDFTYGVVCVRDAEKDLSLTGVILVEPALERFSSGFVAAFEWFQD
jgi:hypothetical protein